MLCLACGAEMRLVQVVEDTTLLVSGYEHQTWQCSGCDSVEQRTTFSRKKRPTHTRRVLGERVSVQPTQTATDELTQIQPVEPAPVAPIQVEQTAQAERSQTAAVETTVSVEATDKPEPPKAKPPQISAATLQTSVLPKTVDEGLRYLTNRATAQNKRRAQFKRDWDDLRTVRSPLVSSGASRHSDRNEPVRPPAAPVAAQVPKCETGTIASLHITPRSAAEAEPATAPTNAVLAKDEPTAPERARGWNLRGLLSVGRQKS
jgi:hypothetical protein